jgi:Ca2+-binding RTX toxin-like protein
MKKIGATPKEGYAIILGSKWNDIFHGDKWGDPAFPYPDAYNGRGGHDFIVGWRGADRLWGGAGNDTIYGGIGTDQLYGGPGNDTLSGERHSDVIAGGEGADIFLFEAYPYDNGGSHLDVITDFDPLQGGEHVQLSMSINYGLVNFADLKSIMIEDGGDVVIDFDGLNILVLENLRIDELSANDFQIRLF